MTQAAPATTKATGRGGRFFRRVLGLALLAFILVVGLVVAVVAKPELIVNARTLAATQKYLLPRLGIDASWETAEISASSYDFFNKRLTLKATKLAMSAPSFDFAANQLDLAFDLALAPRAVRRLPAIGPVTVAGGTILIRKSPESDTSQDAPFDLEKIARFFDGRQLEPVAIDLKQITVVSLPKKGPAVDEQYGSLIVSLKKPVERHFELALNLDGAGRRPLPTVRLQAAIGLHEVDERITPSLDAHFSARMNDKSGAKVDGSVRLAAPQDIHGRGRPIHAALRYRAKAHDFDAQFGGQWREDAGEIAGVLDAQTRVLAGKPFQLKLRPCSLRARSKSFLDADVDLQLGCRGNVKIPGNAPAEIRSFVPQFVAFGGDAHVHLAQTATTRRLDFSAHVQPDRLTLAPLAAHGSMGVEGRIALAPRLVTESLRGNFDLKAEVGDFHALVAKLAATSRPMPAPLNQLRGNVQCAATGTVDLTDESLKLPLTCRTDLRSVDQSLVTALTADVAFEKVHDGIQPVFDAELEIIDVTLVMPDILDVTSRQLPRLLSDGRIADPAVVAAAKRFLPARYELHAKTRTAGALKISSKLIKNAVPIAVDLRTGNDRHTSGLIATPGFEISMMRRTAHVKKLELTFHDNQSSPELNGRIDFDSNDYRMYMDLFGTTAAPRFALYTDPPLPEQDALAMLLFGKRPDLLDEDALRSADEVQAALTDSAINLISMYYLASTPIESIGYNPHTHMMTAKLKLSEGLSLTLGSDAAEANSVGLRKRIGKNLTVETMAMSEAGEDRSRGVAMLRWGKRY